MGKSKGTGKILLIVYIVIISIAVAVAAAFLIYKLGSGTNTPAESAKEVTYVEYPDVEKYYEENSEVESIINVSDSKDIMSEKELAKELRKRGFANASATYEYDMNGNYSEAQDISEKSSEKHPMYSVIYQSASGNIYTISVINGEFLATPFSFELESESEVGVVVSEKDLITSYDSKDNRFFITTPHEDSMRVYSVEKVDAKTLDNLTAEELGL